MKRILVLACLAAAACGERPEAWDAPVTSVTAVGLEGSLALVDDGAHRVVMARPTADLELLRTSVTVGKGVVNVKASADQKRLFVLSTGDVPKKKQDDQGPSLTVVDDGGQVSRRIELPTPLSGLALDPAGRWAVIFPGGDGRAFVENPNQLVFVDLTAAPEKAVTFRTLRSFGGRPQRLTFTPELTLPGGKRHLLVVETDQDVSILDLEHVQDTPERPEITVRLSNGLSTRSLKPAGVVADDGEVSKSDDARIAVRIADDSNVFMLTLAPNPAGSTAPNDFTPLVNLADVGGIASDITFLRTDGGLRLAALVPQTKQAVLVEPGTSVTTAVDLPAAYQRVSLVTDQVAPGGTGDVALLYGSTTSVAFWALGRTSGQPYRSVEVVNIAGGAAQVSSLPAPNQDLKVLSSSGTGFYVLNLKSRTASPLTTLQTARVVPSADGLRLWAFGPGTTNLAQIPVSNLAPLPLPLERPIRDVFDLKRTDGGRALLALDTRGTTGVTVLDAEAPDLRTARSFFGLLQEGL